METLYRFQIDLNDLNRQLFHKLDLRMVQHPSETPERLLIRLLAYLHQYHPDLSFTRGLCVAEEPEIWQRDQSGCIQHWIELGLPALKRLRQACGNADQVSVYSYGGQQWQRWWSQNKAGFQRLKQLRVFRVNTDQLLPLTEQLERRMGLACLIDENAVAFSWGQCNVPVVVDAVL